MNNFTLVMHVDRQGERWDYDLSNRVSSEPVLIREDDKVNFTVTSPIEYGEPILYLQDLPYSFGQLGADPAINKITWEIKQLKNEFLTFFSNHFGYCTLSVRFSSNEAIQLVGTVNILATKFNAEQAEAMLYYLDGKMDNIINFCFSKTQKNIGVKKNAGSDVALMMLHLEKSLSFFMSKKMLFKQKHRYKLIPKLEVISAKDAKSLSERTISWLFQNLEQALPASAGMGNFVLQKKSYSLEKIQSETLYNETDVYENQVILSYLNSMREFLGKVIDNHQRGLFIPVAEELKSPSNYSSFEQILNKLAAPIHAKKVAHCKSLLRQCLTLIKFFSEHLPSKTTKDLRPRVTSFVRANPHYYIAFGLVNDWLNMGEPSWQGEEFLYGLRAINELYEFFCLYKLIDSVKEAGFQLESSELREYSREFGLEGKLSLSLHQNTPNNYYKFVNNLGVVFECYYEPKIWTYTEDSKEGDLVDLVHNGKSQTSCYNPDFLIKVRKPTGKTKFLIFDAKYSRRTTVESIYLPDLMRKYLLGVGQLDNDGRILPCPTHSLYAMHPALVADDNIVHSSYYNKMHGLFDEKPIFPAIGIMEISPSKSNALNNFITKVLATI